MSTGDHPIFGQPGQFLTVGNGISVTYSTPLIPKVDIDLSDNKDFDELRERISGIEKRLAIVIPNVELQSRFPALQEAYDHYKLIEKLVNDQSKNI